MGAVVPLSHVLALANPLETWPWFSERPSDEELNALLHTAPLEPAPVDTNQPAARHIGRIRYLARHGWSDPIEVDVGVPFLGYFGPSWPIVDGNHRLAAAAIRQDSTILIDLSGQLDHAAVLLGVDEDILADGRTPA